MQAMSIKCPNCGANIYVEGHSNKCYCSSCGSQVIVEDGVNRSVNISVDETKEREMSIKQTRYNLALSHIEENTATLKKSLRWKIPAFLACVVIVIIGIVTDTREILGTLGCLCGFVTGGILFNSLGRIASKYDEIRKLDKIWDDK